MNRTVFFAAGWRLFQVAVLCAGLVCPALASTPPEEPIVSISAGSPVGAYYAAGSALAKLFNAHRDASVPRLVTVASQGSEENINAVLSGRMEFGLAQANLLDRAMRGVAPWEGKPAKPLQSVLTLYSEALTLVAAEDAGILSLADLEGKRINIGAPGSSDEETALQILEKGGVNLDDAVISRFPAARASDLLAAGDIDAYFYTVGHPNLSVREATSAPRKARLIPLPPPLIASLVAANPLLQAVEIPTDWYPGLTNRAAIPTVGVKAMLFAREDVAEDTVYRLVKAVLSNPTTFQRQHPVLAALTAGELGAAPRLPFHAGARRAWGEARPVEAVAVTGIKPYFYPFVNPYEATVVPLPAAYADPRLANEVPTREFALKVFPDRKIPSVFWYQQGLICSLTCQDRPAPLLFLVAGTGARYNSPNMVNLQRIFHQAGFHVIGITSPTHMNFVVNASSAMPGNNIEDAKDLYRVMQQADAYARRKVKVTGYALAGYSLGGIESAFVAKLDDERKQFNFERVLLINPPVNLITSVTILDRLLKDNIPGGEANFAPWLREVIDKFAETARTAGPGEAELTGQFIYRLYKYYPPRENFMAALIGTAFRLDSANMVFTTDVMNGGGYIVPRNARLTGTTSLTGFAMTSYRISFVDYFNEWFFPFYAQQEAGLTREALAERTSLRGLESYLKANSKIGLLHNEDDIIMAPGEVAYLAGLFGDRACIFPTGGHLGNLSHPDPIRFMTSFLTGQKGAP